MKSVSEHQGDPGVIMDLNRDSHEPLWLDPLIFDP